MSGNEMKYIEEAFADNWVVPLGPNVNGFEADLEQFVGEGKHVVALSAAAFQSMVYSPLPYVYSSSMSVQDCMSGAQARSMNAYLNNFFISTVFVKVRICRPAALPGRGEGAVGGNHLT